MPRLWTKVCVTGAFRVPLSLVGVYHMGDLRNYHCFKYLPNGKVVTSPCWSCYARQCSNADNCLFSDFRYQLSFDWGAMPRFTAVFAPPIRCPPLSLTTTVEKNFCFLLRLNANPGFALQSSQTWLWQIVRILKVGKVRKIGILRFW